MAKIVANDTPIPGSVGQRIQTIITGRDTTTAAQNLITFVDGADRIEIAGTFSNPAPNTFVGAASRITVFIAGSTALTISEFSIPAQQVFDAILNSSFALFDLLRPLDFVGGAGSDEFYDGTFEDDSLSGAGGDDQLDGGDGDDTIDGGDEDYMEVGDGADVYFVDDLGDYVREDNDVPGIDEVRSTISLSLGDSDIFGSDSTETSSRTSRCSATRTSTGSATRSATSFWAIRVTTSSTDWTTATSCSAARATTACSAARAATCSTAARARTN